MVVNDGAIRTLSVDIRGSGVKVMVLDLKGNPLTEMARTEIPQPATPEAMINEIARLTATQGEYHRVSVGFPGVVRNSVIGTTVNLTPEWVGFDLATALSGCLSQPVRVINDADIMQGLGAIIGKGVELVVTLRTSFGSALFVNSKLVPNQEMGHHQFHKRETYEEQLRRSTLDKIGKEK